MNAILSWTIRADDIGADGKNLTYVAPATALAPLAEAIGVSRVLSCEATVRLVARGEVVLATGSVRAGVEQVCVVTLEPFETEIAEAIDTRFAPEGSAAALPRNPEEEGSAGMADVPEPIVGGTLDLGLFVQELLALGVDLHPRKPGVVFEPPAADAPPSPFAILSKLRGTEGGGTGGK